MKKQNENNPSNEDSNKRNLRIMDKESFFKLVSKLKPNDSSHTIREQIATEEQVKLAYEEFMSDYLNDPDMPSLFKDQHIKFLMKGIRNLPSAFECLDASRPWICYWILHSLCLLNSHLSDDMIESVTKFLNSCQAETGGFGGGPGQIAHLATTYAAVNALCTLNSDRALQIIKLDELAKWIKSLKLENGAFRMHEDGEEDLRGTYCAISVAKICNLESIDPHLFDNVAESIIACQTYEGGFGATPFNEAHGGYSFCGLASLKLLGKENYCDIDRLTQWLVNKQMKFEGGFQGRTNKLVDCCYSFWQGGMFPTIHSILSKSTVLESINTNSIFFLKYKLTTTFLYQDNGFLLKEKNWLFDRHCLQEYIILCCQLANGGVIDKPGKNRDYYHICYGLSGLSISQYFGDGMYNICSNDESLLNQTHPLFNICFEPAFNAISYFQHKKNIQEAKIHIDSDLLNVDK